MNDIAKREPQDLAQHPELEQADPMFALIQSVVRDPEADVDKLERMVALYERQQEKEAVKSFNQDFIRLQNALPNITEGGKIIHKGKTISQYARWDEDINPVIKPILAEHNFTLSFETCTDDGIRVVAHLIHSEGHSRSSSFRLPADTTGAKNDVQAIGSSTSYAKRYAASPLLNLTTCGQDDDGNGAGRRPKNLITDKQFSDLKALREEIGKALPETAFQNYLIDTIGAEGGRLENVPADKYRRVLATLEKRRKESVYA